MVEDAEIVVVKFISSDNKLSKPYYYYVNEEINDIIESNYSFHNYPVVYHIKNEAGYDYHNAFVTIKPILDKSILDLEKILLKNDILFLTEVINTHQIYLENTHQIIKEDINISNIQSREGKKDVAKNLLKDLEFGKETIKFSIYGPAFYTLDNSYLSYNKETEDWVDVTGMTTDDFGFAYSIPVAKNQIKQNDYISHNGNWVRVLEVEDDNTVKVEDIRNKEIITIMPTKNIFGFDFYNKLIYFGIEEIMGKANEDNPFGNILSFMMAEKKDVKTEDLILMVMMMNQSKNGDGAALMNFNDSMMMYMMMNKSGDNNLLPLMLMMNQK